MKKRIIFIALMLTLTSATVFSAVSNTNTIKLGNEKINFETDIITYKDKTYVSVRELCDKLNIPVFWNEAEQLVELDINRKNIPADNNSSEKTPLLKNGIVPDEKTAVEIGRTILENIIGEPMEFVDGDYKCELKALYYEDLNCWLVTRHATYKNKPFYSSTADEYCVYINKNTGEIININTVDSSAKNAIESHKEKHK